MNAAFEHAELGNGAGSREGSEERIRDEQAWLRMEDEGCPNDTSTALSGTGYDQATLGIRDGCG